MIIKKEKGKKKVKKRKEDRNHKFQSPTNHFFLEGRRGREKWRIFQNELIKH